tara:strand:- start:3032 stop:3322 length:291 start_codon:yes stop_codon:yes gene_type:complete
MSVSKWKIVTGDKETRRRIREEVAWYTKWGSSIIVVLAMAMRATGEPAYQIYDLYLSTVGIFGWLVVSILWKDRALIMLNAVGLIILVSGLLKSFV